MRTLRGRYVLPSILACLLPILPVACDGGPDSDPDNPTQGVPRDPDHAQQAQGSGDGDAARDLDVDLGPIPGRIVVKLAPPLSTALRAHLASGKDLVRFPFPEPLAGLHSEYGVTSVRPVFPDSASDDALRRRIADLIAQGRALDPDVELPHLQDIFEIHFDPEAPSTRFALECSLDREHVVAAEPLFPGAVSSCPPGEPLYPAQWGPQRIDADLAWCSASGSGQTIAVIDTGIDAAHPDLGNTSPNGYDCMNGSGVPPTFNGSHGTEMASMAAATWTGFGIAGIAPAATLVSVDITDPTGAPDPSCTASGIQWAATVAGVQNVSLGFRGTSFLLEDAILAAHALDSYVVASAGNDTSIFAANPGLLEHATTVGATDQNDQRWVFSNTGAKLDVAAPGVGTLAATPGGGHTLSGGTSAAAAHVSGLVALLREAQPTWNVEQIRQVVRQGADDVNGGGFDTDMGHGRINADKSVQIARTGIPRPTANIIAPKFDKRIRGKTLVHGFSDVEANAQGEHELQWSSSLAGPYTPIANGPFTGGNAPGNRLLGSVSPATFPSSGRYFLRLKTSDTTNLLESVDYNEIEVCGGCAPKPAGMIAWWPLEKATWPQAKDVAGSNHGTYSGYAVPGQEGYVRDAAGFFGFPLDAVHAPAVAPPSFYEMTVQAWVRRMQWNTSGIIASYRATPTRGWELGVDSSGSLYFSTNMITSNVVTHSYFNALLDDYEYHHVAAVVRLVDPEALVPLEIVIYIDGAPLCNGLNCSTQISPSATFPVPSNPEYILGGGPSLGWVGGLPTFRGNLDEIQVFDTALSDATIAATAAAGCGGTCL